MVDGYFFVLLILLFMFLLEYFGLSTKITIFSSLILVFTAGLRGYHVGADTKAYWSSYLQVKSGYDGLSFEIGYKFMERLGAAIGLSPTQFLFIISLITTTLIAHFFYIYTKYPSAAIAYYYARFFFLRDMNQLRQALAAAILLYGILFIWKKNLFAFSAVVLVAASIHQASLIFFPLYFFVWFFRKKNILNYKKYFSLLIIVLILSLFQTDFLTQILGESNDYLIYSGYVNSLGLLNPLIWLEMVLSILLLRLIQKNKIDSSALNYVVYCCYIVGNFVLILFNRYNTVSGRSSNMFITVEPLILIDVSYNYLSVRLFPVVFIAYTILMYFVR